MSLRSSAPAASRRAGSGWDPSSRRSSSVMTGVYTRRALGCIPSGPAPMFRHAAPHHRARRPGRLGEITTTPRSRRSWSAPGQARQEQFGDSTDLCSLVNAKSGGCAEDCGFCAQSRFAEAETPMHAMMEPEQMLEHARAAEAAGAHRFCMVTQGQGLSKRDFEKVLEGARLVAEHTNLKRCASVGHMSRRARQGAAGGRHPARPPQRRDGRVLLPGGVVAPSATRAACARSTRSARPGWRPASAAS